LPSSAGLKKGAFFETALLGSSALISRTGYTGEAVGYETFVHPARAEEVWKALLEAGEPVGLKPAGLAARDSLRIEAGLPLYGHELAGPEGIRPGGAGFGAYVKFHKTFFIGRAPCLEAERNRTMETCRFRMEERGVRVPRPGDPVVNRKGRVIGRVTSCAGGTDGHLVGLAFVERGQAQTGTPLGIFPLPQRPVEEKANKADLAVGDRVLLAELARVLERFPSAAERNAWR
jgi:glycine hydroxymethyltransferase